MAALTAGRVTSQRIPGKRAYPMKAATTIFAGGMVAIDSSGLAVPADATVTNKTVGVAATNGGLSSWENAGGNSALTVEVYQGEFKFNNSAAGDAITIAEVGASCFVVDDQTVAKTDNTGARPIAGLVTGVDADGVWVDISLALSATL